MARYQGRFEHSRRRPAPEKAPQEPVLPAEEAPSAADPAEAVTAQMSETSQEPERAAEKVSAHTAENAPEDGASKKKKRGSRIGVILVCILVVLAAAMGSLALHVYLRGKRMRQNTSAPNLAALQQPAAPAEAPEAPLPEEEAPAPEEPEKALEVVDEGTIRYGGKLYRYNSDITTFLLLGIDSQQPENTDGTCNVDAFSDVIMLAAVDFRNRQISLLTLSRDTMCEFQRLNPDGSERDWATGQLALTFSYGDGALKSCEITKNAVSQALSDLPIQSCSALYLDGLRRLTDAVGGVTVTVLEDLSYGYASMQPGAEVTLDRVTGGPAVNESLETNVPGIFACGNVLHVHDLVDYVSEEAARAGRAAAKFVRGGTPKSARVVKLTGRDGVRYTVPQTVRPAAMGESVVVRFRVANPYYGKYLSCYVDGERISHRKKQIMAPGEMESFTLTREALGESAQEVVFCVEEE